jgi:TolB protein
VTASEANDENPMFSPDSDHVVFESNRDGDHKDQLYSVKSDGSGLKRLTHDDANNIFPGWSPDGKRVIFGSSRPAVPEDENKLYVMEGDGSGAKSLGVNGFFARWSPKGDRIAVISGRYPVTRIRVMKADGSNR